MSTSPKRAAACPALAALLILSACASEPPESASAEPATAAEPAHIDDWCAGHGLPESKCTKCDPHLIADAYVACTQ